MPDLIKLKKNFQFNSIPFIHKYNINYIWNSKMYN